MDAGGLIILVNKGVIDVFVIFLRAEKIIFSQAVFTILFFDDQVCQWAKVFGPT